MINTYLLEKSRVVQPEEGERNYHVFYQLLGQAAKDAELRAKYDLGPPETFFYLNQSSVKTIQGVCEASEFSKLIDALQVGCVRKCPGTHVVRRATMLPPVCVSGSLRARRV